MVKQAEKIYKRSPLAPIYGIVIGAGLGVVAVLTMQYLTGPQTPFPQVAAAAGSLGRDSLLGHGLIAFAIWCVLLAIAYFAVGLLTGKNPNSPQDIPMPPRHISEQSKRKKS